VIARHTWRSILKIEKLILPARAEAAEGRLRGHIAEVGKRYVLVDDENFPQGRVYMMVRIVRPLRAAKKHLEDHVHEVDSVMTFIGDKEDLTGLDVEIHLENKKKVVHSPVSVYVPSGVKHGLLFLNGSGKYINVVLTVGGNYNAVTRTQTRSTR
jgi:hypothetical protein